MIRFATLFLVTSIANAASAQSLLARELQNDTMPNLVPNASFEQTKRLQCAWTQKARKFSEDVMIGWNSPTETTPDHFSVKNDPKCWGHPGSRTDGRANPRTGDCMVGIKTWGRGNTPTYWHEYIQIELSEPLVAGQRYIAELYTMRAVFSNEASNNLGMYLSPVAVKTRDCLPLYFAPQVNEEQTMDGKGWHKVRGVFEAKGGERFLVIGNFCSDQLTHHVRMPEGERGAYYFIDDVNVRIAPESMKTDPLPTICIPPPPRKRVPDHASTATVDMMDLEPEVGKSIVLNNIFFDLDKATLKKESEAELDRLVALLTDYPLMQVEIQGHTDDQGSDTHNQQLSEARAKAVVDYLDAHKIDRERLTWKGYGEAQPLEAGTTEEVRAKNRRVEFKVIER